MHRKLFLYAGRFGEEKIVSELIAQVGIRVSMLMGNGGDNDNAINDAVKYHIWKFA